MSLSLIHIFPERDAGVIGGNRIGLNREPSFSAQAGQGFSREEVRKMCIRDRSRPSCSAKPMAVEARLLLKENMMWGEAGV